MKDQFWATWLMEANHRPVLFLARLRTCRRSYSTSFQQHKLRLTLPSPPKLKSQQLIWWNQHWVASSQRWGGDQKRCFLKQFCNFASGWWFDGSLAGPRGGSSAAADNVLSRDRRQKVQPKIIVMFQLQFYLKLCTYTCHKKSKQDCLKSWVCFSLLIKVRTQYQG